MMGSTGGKIDGDAAAMQLQAKLSSEATVNLQNSSQRVTNVVGDGVSVSSGLWRDGLMNTEENRHGFVTGRIAPMYQEDSDGMYRAVGYYQDADDAATRETGRVTFGGNGGHGIASQI
ncbi:hypothetical protein GCM10027290_55200 [Micromonospora sonneratiae]|uniref:Uncharacterized protein n=1 Tax=Micromonospora sonneratiae TaxID=1184706 RepID=A0ABW3YRS4_9ACTN